MKLPSSSTRTPVERADHGVTVRAHRGQVYAIEPSPPPVPPVPPADVAALSTMRAQVRRPRITLGQGPGRRSTSPPRRHLPAFVRRHPPRRARGCTNAVKPWSRRAEDLAFVQRHPARRAWLHERGGRSPGHGKVYASRGPAAERTAGQPPASTRARRTEVLARWSFLALGPDRRCSAAGLPCYNDSIDCTQSDQGGIHDTPIDPLVGRARTGDGRCRLWWRRRRRRVERGARLVVRAGRDRCDRRHHGDEPDGSGGCADRPDSAPTSGSAATTPRSTPTARCGSPRSPALFWDPVTSPSGYTITWPGRSSTTGSCTPRPMVRSSPGSPSRGSTRRRRQVADVPPPRRRDVPGRHGRSTRRPSRPTSTVRRRSRARPSPPSSPASRRSWSSIRRPSSCT